MRVIGVTHGEVSLGLPDQELGLELGLVADGRERAINLGDDLEVASGMAPLETPTQRALDT